MQVLKTDQPTERSCVIAHPQHVAGHRIMLFASPLRWLFHQNALGSTTMMTDQTGAVQLNKTFYPWGQAWGRRSALTGSETSRHSIPTRRATPFISHSSAAIHPPRAAG